ncbi:hypothetical protein CCACVL1_14868 [Corchorus capsularis]|uniref:Uncharacterized protein n=1 Tax=Corchorus capsularis TaxID=210143 RepID=A0A1R3I533_COCAP|nr:hypothetical protein CCACVL1_14868 [Corchorus capsularis]
MARMANLEEARFLNQKSRKRKEYKVSGE